MESIFAPTVGSGKPNADWKLASQSSWSGRFSFFLTRWWLEDSATVGLIWWKQWLVRLSLQNLTLTMMRCPRWRTRGRGGGGRGCGRVPYDHGKDSRNTGPLAPRQRKAKKLTDFPIVACSLSRSDESAPSAPSTAPIHIPRCGLDDDKASMCSEKGEETSF